MKNFNRLLITVLLLFYFQFLLSCAPDGRTPFERVQQDGLKQPKKTWKERAKEYIKKLFEKRDDSDGK